MTSFKTKLAILIGKITYFFLRLIHSGGLAAPGLIGLKLDPKLIIKLKHNLSSSIVVSGTNGKTTTTRMIASILKTANLSYLHNRTGSNLLRGIASELIQASKLNANFSSRLGLWEVDEAVLPEAIVQLQPKIVVLTNLFRDQLDRYGEIDTLAKKWLAGLQKLAADSIVILNADDPTLVDLGKKISCQVLYFGIKDKTLGSSIPSHASDATFCPRCFRPLKYESCFISHLGIYACEKCGQIQPQPNTFCTQAKLLKNYHTQIFINYLSKQYHLTINLPGVYNIYNALACFTVAKLLNLNEQTIKAGFQLFQPAFGRFETIQLQQKTLRIMLVKNPTGFNEVLKIFIHLTKNNKAVCLLVLNDLIADGRDVSWIWDVDLEELNQANLAKIYVSGIRAYDLALRLKYANLKLAKNIQIIPKISLAIKKLLQEKNQNLVILPTYTAMLETRKILNQLGLVKSSWDD